MAEAKGAATAARFPAGKITIEVQLPKNRNWSSYSIQQKLRGSWRMSQMVGKTASGGFSQMPDIPGIHLTLDCNKRTLRVFDPLEIDRELLDRVSAVHKHVWQTAVRGQKEVIQKDLSDNRMKTILHEWGTLVHLREKLIVREGVVPTPDKVLDMPGRLEINQFNSDPAAPKVEGDPDMRGQEGMINALRDYQRN